MELFILISCVLLLVLNMILIGLHVRSRKNNTAQEVSRSISDLEKVIRDESRYNRENDENRSRKDREELASTLNHFRTEHRETLKNITTQTNSAIQAFQKSFAESMELFNRLLMQFLMRLPQNTVWMPNFLRLSPSASLTSPQSAQAVQVPPIRL